MTERNEPRFYQQISNGVYRVSGTVRRSPRTGKYVVDSARQTSSRTALEPKVGASKTRF